MSLVSGLAFHALLGVVCAAIAGGRGRSAAGWFVVGFVFQCFALVLLLVLPDLSADAARLEGLELENRRLRERLRKDRAVADHRHEVTAQRLDVHDHALGVDTARLGGAGPASSTASAADPGGAGRAWAEASWYYLDDRRQATGPVAFAELRRLWRAGVIGARHYVWRDGMADWRTLADVRELENALRV